MSKTQEALADVRRWLCSNLSKGDAGMVCGMLSTVSRESSELLDENAKLKQELEAVGTAAYLYGRTDLADENAKLRELVREIWRSCPVSEDDCAKCPHRLEESDEVWCDIPILMEKLGVEVDG